MMVLHDITRALADQAVSALEQVVLREARKRDPGIAPVAPRRQLQELVASGRLSLACRGQDGAATWLLDDSPLLWTGPFEVSTSNLGFQDGQRTAMINCRWTPLPA